MNIEEKAKAYDEAVERAKDCLTDRKFSETEDTIRSVMEYIFPELAESEDEKVRKEIIEVLQFVPSSMWEQAKTDYKRCFAYLEKQKEHLPIPDKFSGLKSLMLQYLQSAANRKDDTEIESDTDLWGRKILDYVWKYSDEQKEKNEITIKQVYKEFINPEKLKDAKTNKYIRAQLFWELAHNGIITAVDYQYLIDDNRKPWTEEEYLKAYRKGFDVSEQLKQKEQKPLTTEETELNSIAFLEQMGYTCIPPRKEQKPAEPRKRNKPKESWLSKTKYEIEHADELLIQRQEELREIRELKKQEQKPVEFTHHEMDESLKDAVTHQMEDDGDVDDFVRRGIDDIALKYAELGAKWQKEQKPAENHTLEFEKAKAKYEGIVEGKQTVLDNPEDYGLCKPAEWDDYTKTNLDRAIQIIKDARGNLYGYQTDDGLYECDKAIEALEHFLYRGLEIEKPAEWSDTDNIGWDEAFACVTRAEKSAKNEEELQNAVTAEKWLKEIKFKYYVHPVKQEWSEFDRDCLKRAIWYVENPAPTVVKDINLVLWLQSIPERFNLEPKEEWSDEDTEMYINVASSLRGYACGLENEEHKRHIQKGLDWLENRFKSLHPQPKQEWSKEDEEMLTELLLTIEPSDNYDEMRNWLLLKLKSLLLQGSKDSLQTHWKPSENIDIYEVAYERYPINNRLVREVTKDINEDARDGFIDGYKYCDSTRWKPSEEQIEALEYVIRDYREDSCNATANYLQEILDHLKNM